MDEKNLFEGGKKSGSKNADGDAKKRLEEDQRQVSKYLDLEM